MNGSKRIWILFTPLLFAIVGSERVDAAPPPASSSPAPGKWVRIEAKPVQIDGQIYTPTCSQATGSDPAYAFWFQEGTSDGLVVFFDGGGSCWNDDTCSKPRLSGEGAVFEGAKSASVYKAMILPSDDPSRMSGLFDANDPNNPVRDWSKIFVSYCTGDVHSGSNTASYRDPVTGHPFKIEHRGWDNVQVIKQWMRENVRKPARLFVCGSSAGAYGAATHYAALRELYPDARATYLGDGGMGVTTPEFEKARNASWNYKLPPSVFGPDAQLTPDSEVVARLAAHFPNDRFSQYTTVHDVIQTGFYGQQGGPRTDNAWTDKMTRELALRQKQPNFRSYVAEGSVHTILRSAAFYTQRSGGMPFADWVKALIADQAMPANMSCSDCPTRP